MWEDWLETKDICKEKYETTYIKDFYNNSSIKKPAN